MKILVFSDSHGVILPMRSAVRRERPDCVFFLGDGDDDINTVMQLEGGFTLYAVRGNCDAFSSCSSSVVADIGSHRLFAAHGHLYSDIFALAAAAKKEGANVCLFGHTHTPLISECENVKMMNPGSIRDGATYGVICGDDYFIRSAKEY